MRMSIIAAAITGACVLGASGCGSPARSCGVADYGAAGQHGFATPRYALRSVLVADPWLPHQGWIAAHREARAVEFRSGNGSVDVVKRTDGHWLIGAVTACQ